MTKKCQKKYEQSEKGKAKNKRYRQSAKGKLRQKRYKQTEKGKEIQRQVARRQRAIHPERTRANNAVNNAIGDGKFLPPHTYTCIKCSKVPAEQYHHHLGYAPEHYFHIIPVCRICHIKLHQIVVV